MGGIVVDRRNFVASVGLTLAAGAAPAHASATAWIELVTTLQDALDKGTQAIDWLFWSQDAVVAMQQGKAPPPSPLAPAIFQERLEKDRARISALEIPSYEAPLPGTGAVPTNGFDATRAAIRRRIGLLQDCLAEESESRGAIKYIQQTDRALTTQESMLQALARALWDLAQKYPVPLIQETLAFQALDVEGSYLKTVGDTRAILAGKRKAAETALAARRLALRAAAIEVRNVLLVEAIDLGTEVRRLEQLEREVKALQDGVVAADQARQAAYALVDRRSSMLDAAILDREETEARLDAARREASRIDSQIASVQAAAEKPYICPINKVSWDECTNPDHVIHKIGYNQQRDRLLNDLKNLQKRRTEQRTLVNDIASDLRWEGDQVRMRQEELQAAQDELSKAETRLQAARDALAKKVQLVLEEKWRSRADLFSRENASDQEEVGAALNRLSDNS